MIARTRLSSAAAPRSSLRRDPESPARRYGRHMGEMSETRTRVHALPDFERPPLTEVALGVVFEPVEIGAVGLGELYQRWRGEFPKVQEHAALPPLFEPPQPGLGLVVEVGHPPMRLWMLNETEDQLVQAQRDRLVVNWRRIGDGDYPRYHALRALLGRQLADFWSFLRDRAVPLPPPVAVEATYVNTIDAAGLADFLVAVNPLPERLGVPTEASISLVFDTPSGTPAPQRVALFSTRDRSEDARYVLRVSVLGQLSAWDELDRSIAVAHEQAVRTFADVTTDAMHRYWGRRI